MAKIQKISLPFSYTTELIVYEKGVILSDNSNKSVWSIPDGYSVKEIIYSSDFATVLQNESGIEYTLLKEVNHSLGSGENIITDSFTVIVTSIEDEIEYTLAVNVKIIDNIPSISSDSSEKEATTENPVVNGNLLINYGADFKNQASIAVNGIYGTESEDSIIYKLNDGTLILLKESNSYSFTVNGNESRVIHIRFSITDSDGDTAATVVKVIFSGIGEQKVAAEYRQSIVELCNLGLQLIDVIKNYAVRNDLTTDEIKDLTSKYSDIGSFALGEGIITNENQKKFLNYVSKYTIYDSIVKHAVLDLKQNRSDVSEQIESIRKGLDEVIKLIV